MTVDNIYYSPFSKVIDRTFQARAADFNNLETLKDLKEVLLCAAHDLDIIFGENFTDLDGVQHNGVLHQMVQSRSYNAEIVQNLVKNTVKKNDSFIVTDSEFDMKKKEELTRTSPDRQFVSGQNRNYRGIISNNLRLNFQGKVFHKQNPEEQADGLNFTLVTYVNNLRDYINVADIKSLKINPLFDLVSQDKEHEIPETEKLIKEIVILRDKINEILNLQHWSKEKTIDHSSIIKFLVCETHKIEDINLIFAEDGLLANLANLLNELYKYSVKPTSMDNKSFDTSRKSINDIVDKLKTPELLKMFVFFKKIVSPNYFNDQTHNAKYYAKKALEKMTELETWYKEFRKEWFEKKVIVPGKREPMTHFVSLIYDIKTAPEWLENVSVKNFGDVTVKNAVFVKTQNTYLPHVKIAAENIQNVGKTNLLNFSFNSNKINSEFSFKIPDRLLGRSKGSSTFAKNKYKSIELSIDDDDNDPAEESSSSNSNAYTTSNTISNRNTQENQTEYVNYQQQLDDLLFELEIKTSNQDNTSSDQISDQNSSGVSQQQNTPSNVFRVEDDDDNDFDTKEVQFDVEPVVNNKTVIELTDDDPETDSEKPLKPIKPPKPQPTREKPNQFLFMSRVFGQRPQSVNLSDEQNYQAEDSKIAKVASTLTGKLSEGAGKIKGSIEEKLKARNEEQWTNSNNNNADKTFNWPSLEAYKSKNNSRFSAKKSQTHVNPKYTAAALTSRGLTLAVPNTPTNNNNNTNSNNNSNTNSITNSSNTQSGNFHSTSIHQDNFTKTYTNAFYFEEIEDTGDLFTDEQEEFDNTKHSPSSSPRSGKK